ncbi:MAG TPA: ATP synthase F1 subunit delta [Solirubrobacteraceae bacterium]|jgi:ATP synthase F1 delta subunit|nr:ATP synthase F1 subunit delta [Solirubrobacteraceae bacterium]
MQEIANVYARALFEAAHDKGALDTVREQLAQFTDTLADSQDLQVFFYSPYFSVDEQRQGLAQALSGADTLIENFLDMLIENRRMPVLAATRARFEELWEHENRLIPVEVTSAIELDEKTVGDIGERIGAQTGRKVQLTSRVDPDIIGGIVLRVGNSILDASIRNRLDQLRKEVVRGA